MGDADDPFAALANGLDVVEAQPLEAPAAAHGPLEAAEALRAKRQNSAKLARAAKKANSATRKRDKAVAEQEAAQSQLRFVAEACPEAVESAMPKMRSRRGKGAIAKTSVQLAVLNSCSASSVSSKTRTRRVTRGEAAIAQVSHSSMVDGSRVLLDELRMLRAQGATIIGGFRHEFDDAQLPLSQAELTFQAARDTKSGAGVEAVRVPLEDLAARFQQISSASIMAQSGTLWFRVIHKCMMKDFESDWVWPPKYMPRKKQLTWRK